MKADSPVHLRRRLNLPLLVLYGLGTTIGAGIFVLVGKVAGRAGMWAPLSFLMASLLAAFTAVAFAELVARYPKSAGEAVYVRAGFGSRRLALAVGLMVALSGMVSASAIVIGAVGYMGEFLALPPGLGILVLVALLAVIATWGIGESVTAASLFTVLEIGALLLVIWVARDSFGDIPARWPELLPPFEGGAWMAIAAGSMLAFYAFLGFEDLVNVAEETRDATRTLPAAIFLTLVITSVIYGGVTLVAVLTVSPAELAASEAPLALVYRRAGGGGGGAISLVAIFAVLNGALIQIIMASRVLYGLSAQGWLPAMLARVNARTATPLAATGAVAGGVLVLALFFPLEQLAEATSAIILVVFALVNLALVRIKRREIAPPPGLRCYPIWIPATGFLVSAGFLALQFFR